MAEKQSAEQLLGLVAAHNTQPLGELYDRLAPRLFGVLRRIVSDRATAEEVLLESFVRLWNESRHLKEAQASVETWLVLIGRAAAVARRRGREAGRRRGAHAEKTFAWLPTPRDTARLEERRDLLKKVLMQLPGEQRHKLELVVFDGLTEKEVAQKLREPLARAKTSLRAGLAYLRHRLRAVLGAWAANI